MFLTLDDVRSALMLTPIFDGVQLTGVSTDTRTLKPENLFVALKGENYDGHDYVGRAFQLGASTAVVDRHIAGFDGQLLFVPDTLVAYGKIARAWRQKFVLPVVAITGSVAKTTMKEMTALTLSSLGPVLKSDRNENNEVGVPQTLLRLTADHRSAVIEMGMRGFGQIKYLAEIARPTIGIITVIGESHIEMVGNRDGIAQAKGELIESLSSEAVAVLNADDQYFGVLAGRSPTKIVSYGTSPTSDVRVDSVRQLADGWAFALQIHGTSYPVSIRSPAKHDLVNAAGAVAAALAAGVNPERAIADLASYRSSNMRMEVLTSRSGAVILSDCYNAAPSSVKSALNTLAVFRSTGTRRVFLGDMRELGDYSQEMHLDVAREAENLSITEVYPVGQSMPRAFPKAAQSFLTAEDAADFVMCGLPLQPDDVVLVKGSRALHLEKVVEALVQR